MQGGKQEKPLGWVWITESYEVTWRVDKDKANDFVNKRKG